MKVRPGHCLTFRRSGQLSLRSYWDHVFPTSTVPESRSIDEMILGVRERLVEAVRLRLRSDVPLAVYLSGGIDSACIAGIATSILRETNPDAKLATFTLAFPGASRLEILFSFYPYV